MKIILILFLLIFLHLTAAAQSDNNVVAFVGERNITAEEFKIRFEFSPFISKNLSENIDSLKNEFLLLLISEKLWALEAEKLGIDKSEKFNFYFDPVRKIYLRDALFEEKIKKKISINDKEILKGIGRYNSTLIADIINSADSNIIFDYYAKLNSGISIDSLLKTDKNPDKFYSREEIKFGMFRDENLEDILFNLKIKENTAPIKTEDGWYIFQLINKEYKTGHLNDNEIKSRVTSILTDRKTENLYKDFYNNFFSGRTAEINELLYNELYKKILNIFLNEKNNDYESRDEKYFLTESDVLSIKKEFSDEELQTYLIESDNIEIKLIEFLADLVFNPLSTAFITKDEITTRLNQRMKNFIQDEMLVHEAIRLNLSSNEKLQKELDLWRTNYLAQILKNKYADSVNVTDEEVKNYYDIKRNSNSFIKEVNIIEIRTDSLTTIENILNEIKDGKKFKDLAVKYNSGKLKENAEKGSGFFPVSAYGEIGLAADKMSIGDIYGPIKIKNQYSVFQLIDIKESKDTIIRSFESEKEALREELKYHLLNESFTKASLDFVNEFPVKINTEILTSVNVTSIKMFVHRLMGFGGRIAAVPIISPVPNLIQLEKLKEKLLP